MHCPTTSKAYFGLLRNLHFPGTRGGYKAALGMQESKKGLPRVSGHTTWSAAFPVASCSSAPWDDLLAALPLTSTAVGDMHALDGTY